MYSELSQNNGKSKKWLETLRHLQNKSFVLLVLTSVRFGAVFLTEVRTKKQYMWWQEQPRNVPDAPELQKASK